MRVDRLIVTTVLLLLMILVIAGCGNAPAATNKYTYDNTPSAAKADSVELVYFHTKDACHCMAVVKDNIEYAVGTYFKNEVSSGKVKLTMIVSDDPDNAEIMAKYDAMLFTLFIKETRGNKEIIYPVSDIWNMTGDDNRDKLIDFIRNTVTDILEGKKI